jgi:2-dehydro-3-deoxygalactonokinase
MPPMTDTAANGPFLAADWGTSNLRAWVIEADGAVRDVRKFPWGVAKLQPGEAQSALEVEVRPALGAEDLPAILCGMIGSNLGIAAVPYADCPLDAEALAGRLHRVEGEGPPAWIVPGLRCRRPNGDPDVIRGEETKVLGWLAQDRSRREGERLLCLPSTHAKWILVRDGRIERFLTAMSGELFEVLGRHGVLKSAALADDEAAFDEGLKAGDGDEPLASRLFATRSRVVGGGMAAEDARSYLSGLLVGDETSKMIRDFAPSGPVALLGEPELCRWYERALERLGLVVETEAGDGAVIAGLTILRAKGAVR